MKPKTNFEREEPAAWIVEVIQMVLDTVPQMVAPATAVHMAVPDTAVPDTVVPDTAVPAALAALVKAQAESDINYIPDPLHSFPGLSSVVD